MTAPPWAFALWRQGQGWTLRASGREAVTVDLSRRASVAEVLRAADLPEVYADPAHWEEGLGVDGRRGFLFWTRAVVKRTIPIGTVVAMPLATARYDAGTWKIRAFTDRGWRSWIGAGGFADTLRAAGLPSPLSDADAWVQVTASEWRHRDDTWTAPPPVVL